jgi:hypothetical protein
MSPALLKQFVSSEQLLITSHRKATIFLKHHECDTRASVGGEIPGPRLIVISHGNRTMTWEAYAAQYKQDLDQDVNRAQLFPDEIPLNVDKFFNLYPNTGRYFMGNFHKDTAAIDHIPGAGQLSQYLPRSIDTELVSDTCTDSLFGH